MEIKHTSLLQAPLVWPSPCSCLHCATASHSQSFEYYRTSPNPESSPQEASSDHLAPLEKVLTSIKSCLTENIHYFSEQLRSME